MAKTAACPALRPTIVPHLILPAAPSPEMLEALRTAATPEAAYAAMLEAAQAKPFGLETIRAAVVNAFQLCPEAGMLVQLRWMSESIARALGIQLEPNRDEPLHPDWQACLTLDALADGIVANSSYDSRSAFRADVLHCLRRAQQLDRTT